MTEGMDTGLYDAGEAEGLGTLPRPRLRIWRWVSCGG